MHRLLAAIVAGVIAVAMGAPALALNEYPFQPGSSLNAAGINYDSLKALQAMKRLKELEAIVPRN